ncbi:LEAF RUST 10 DISEASE-RESISTANCE LOCUS RECEPTOR-LIKE PROTEIN KINASE-like 2.1 [Durio zibethinus]|uniref:LEAF RUST 10 DISEASE-RESISTANCE LOCUS RECEPTOR-LIKE PROTEIN KINASE-like 2.1 n=1 Tax=Durio zibethinus TaxID=66656 RepID=A0A6P6A3C4_DURZI|nr:LEAF RUST 10 DISEASE-RESISTANCE LOCUS RECEPTOR-LIKE PROTEIN KINASE-like 2.1 [Durio zibethinus]XP_022759273.1 LEAF RUST 10 DISEASE-RESISTANCE LOCUS RECEPTOR-LIKE PROTEIN KINASE-like 2.1 [Durio zibethinus]
MAALVGLSCLLTITGSFRFIGLLTVFLSIQVLVCLCSIDHKNDPECNKPFRCGIIQDLSYPFRQRGSPDYCGEPGFELYCEGGNPMITISSQSYQVLVFNMSLRTLTIAPISGSDGLLCPQHLVNTSLNLSPFQSLYNTRNITLYYDCSSNANQTVGLVDHQFSCTMNGTQIIAYFVVTSAFTNLSAEAKDALRSCHSSVLLPAFASILQVLERNPSRETLVMALENGFGLQWSGNNSLSGSSNGFSSKFKLTIGFAVAGAAILVFIVMVVAFRLKRESLSRGMLMNFQRGKRKQWKRIEAFILQYGSELAPKRYSYSDIKKITKSFKDELGQGGFGTVYKGKLPDGRLVAVKVLSESKGDGEEFINEVASISRTSHVNIVPFLGFCYEGSIRALMYEFMPNGSLDKFLCNRASPDNCHQLELKTLYDIAIGIARGLEYLHQGCTTRILHFDIKPHNILLDESFCPKISDFGLAKLCERKESILSTISARGTIGYIAPEVFCRSFGAVSHKSDVYSYGMMVLEMVGEKENVHSRASDANFPLWIYDRLKQGAELNLQGMTAENEELTRKMIIVSLWCIQSNPSDRPSMTRAMEMLQGSIESLPIPPTPFLFSPPRAPENSMATSLFTRSNLMDTCESFGVSYKLSM